MSEANRVDRRVFLGTSVAGTISGMVLAAGGAGAPRGSGGEPPKGGPAASASAQSKSDMPYGMIGKAKISRLMLGGNLVTGAMHSRDLAYVGPLFRAYVTEEKIFETFRLAEEQGINTVFESGLAFVQRYNQQRGGRMQIIPSIHPESNLDQRKLRREVQGYLEAGAAAVYVWGVAGDTLMKAGQLDVIARSVEIAKSYGLPVGVGRPFAFRPRGVREGQGALRFLRQDVPRRRVPVGHAERAPQGLHVDRRRQGLLRQHVVHQRRGDRRVHAERHETLDRVQGAGRRCNPAAAGILLRFPQRRGFHRGRDVRLPDRQNCEIAQRIIRGAKDRSRPWRA